MRFLAFLFCAAAACFAQQGYSVETLAGNGVAGYSGDTGPASRAQLNNPASLAFDPSGRLYIADVDNRRVRRVDLAGRISTVATSDDPILDIAVDLRSTLYISSGTKLRAITAAGGDSPVNGPGSGWSAIGAISGEPTGTVLVADGPAVYRVATNGITLFATLPAPVTSLYAGLASTVAIAGGSAYNIASSGDVTPIAGARTISAATRIAADRWGDVYLSGVRITKVIKGTEYPLIGLSDPGYSGDGGPAVSAAVNSPTGLAVDRGGNVYFADTANQRVRLLRPAFAGNIEASVPVDGSVDIWPRDITLGWSTFLQPTTYDVWFGTSPDTLTKIGSTATGTFKPAGNLADRTRYFWQIRTQYAPQPPTESPVFSFTTTSSAAVPPSQPTNPTPLDSAAAQSVSPFLSWSGGGAVQYALYLGTAENSLQPIGVVTEPRVNLSDLAPETTYYWQVVAVNDIGATPSKTWKFTTGPVNGYPWVLDPLAGAPLPVDDGRNATEAVLASPRYPAVDTSGNIYFVSADRVIRRIGTDGKLGTIYTLPTGTLTALAADPNNGQILYATPDYIYRIDGRNRVRTYVAGQIGRRGFGGDDGPAAQAVFDGISSMAMDRRGNLYVADTGNNRVRVISGGRVRTVAGSGVCGDTTGSGPAASLQLCAPSLVAVDASGLLYVYASGMVLRIGADGTAERIGGTGKLGYSGDNGPAVEADLGPASGLAVDRFGYVYLADRAANTIRIIDPSGVITTWGGVPNPQGGFSGDIQPAGQARFAGISGITLDTGDYLVVADTGNLRIRRADNVDVFRTVGGTDAFRGDRGNANAAWLFGPSAVAIDGGSNVLVADSLNNRIRRVTPTRSIDTVAGGGAGSVLSAAPGRDARELRLDLSAGAAVAIDERGNLLFNSAVPVPLAGPADAPTQAILTMSPGSLITSVTLMRIGEVGGIVRGRSGEIYVSDAQNHRIWRIGADGTPVVIAGTGAAGATGDGGQAISAQLNTPRSLAINTDGELFVAEVGRIRKITAAGRISTVAFENASGLAFDKDGQLFVASGRSVYLAQPDRRDRTIFTLVRIAGRESGTAVTDNITALEAAVTDLRGLAAGPSGELVFADYGQNAVRRMLRNIPESVSVVSGDGQTVNDRLSLPQPLKVKVTGRNGVPVAGITVRLVNVTEGQTPSLIGSALSDASGVATFYPYLPMKAPQLRVDAVVFGVATPAHFTLTGSTGTQQP